MKIHEFSTKLLGISLNFIEFHWISSSLLAICCLIRCKTSASCVVVTGNVLVWPWWSPVRTLLPREALKEKEMKNKKMKKNIRHQLNTYIIINN